MKKYLLVLLVAILPAYAFGGSAMWLPNASDVKNSPAGTVSSTDVQGAINELSSEKTGTSVTATAPANPTTGDLWVDTKGATSSLRVMFVSDTHASVDATDRNPQWGTNTFSRLQSGFASLSPDYLVWGGDLIDFLPAEWNEVKTWVDWVKTNHPNVEQHAVMGNHDYMYYDYCATGSCAVWLAPQAQEIETYLTATGSAGATAITVKSTDGFIVGQSVIVIETPDYNTTNNYKLTTVAAINSATSMTLTDALNVTYAANTTAVRQGQANARGISKFLETFAGTTTKDTKHVFTVGNTAFILLSTDNYFSSTRTDGFLDAISTEDLDWLEKNVAAYHLTHNVIILTHILPDVGSEINVYDWSPTISYFSPEIKNRFRQIASNYNVVAWVMGHAHPDARTQTVNGQNTARWGNTTFIELPSTGVGAEGQLVTIDFTSGASTIDFKYWSTNTSAYFKTVAVPAQYAISFPEKNKAKYYTGTTWAGLSTPTPQAVPAITPAMQNVGTGTGLYSRKLNNVFQLKGIKAGTGISLASDADSVTITNTGGSGGSQTPWAQDVNAAGYKLIGGTGTTSALTLQTTTGVGTTGADIIFKGGNNGATELARVTNGGYLSIGAGATPEFPLTVNSAMNTGPAGTASIVVVGGDNKERIEIRSSGADPGYQGRRSAGTPGAPTATTADTYLTYLGGGGHDGTTWSGSRGLFGIKAAELFTPTSLGSYFVFETTATGSTTRSEKMRLSPTGQLGIGTAAPTATLHLKAGSATAGTAPLKLTSGPLMTTPEAGALEFLTDNVYFTNSSGVRTALGSSQSGNFTSSLIIPSGANPVTDSAGKIAIDTSAGAGAGLRIYADAAYTLPAMQTQCADNKGTLANDNVYAWRAPYNITLRATHCKRVGGTSLTGRFERCSDGGCSVTDSDMTCNTTDTSDSVVANPLVSAGDYIIWNVVSAAGTITQSIHCFDYTVDQVN